MKKYNYVTPTSQLEIISMYKKLLGEKRHETSKSINRLASGLTKINDAQSQTAGLQKEIGEKKPILERLEKEASKMAIVIAKDLEDAQVVQAEVAIEEDKAQKIADTANAFKEEATTELAKAEPELVKALAALKDLNPQDITQIKSQASPPAKVEFIIEAVCIVLGIKPRDKKMSGFQEAKMNNQFLNQVPTNFIKQLVAFKKEEILTEAMMKKLDP